MTPHHATRIARVLAALAGTLDFFTGLGLVFAPGWTLRAMGASPVAPEALVFLRFVGAFVGAVGLVYLVALLRRNPRDLRVMLGMTIIFRLAAGSYSATAVACGWLEPVWLGVPATDFFLAVVQAWLLTKGAGRAE